MGGLGWTAGLSLVLNRLLIVVVVVFVLLSHSAMAASGAEARGAMVPVNGGKYLREPYRFGRGTFGDVYEAVVAANGERVCLKVVELPATGLSARHTREIELWSALDHENIAPLRDWFVDTVRTGRSSKQVLGLVTDLYEFGSLRTVLRQDAEESRRASAEHREPRFFLTHDRMAAIARGVLSGLRYLHSRRPTIVHGDLKPENVCLGVRRAAGGPMGSEDALEVCIIDFGSAGTEGEMSRARDRGTLVYHGPQRVQQGLFVGAADDCWAAGLLLAQCVLRSEIDTLFPSVRDVRALDGAEMLRSKLPSGRAEEVEVVVGECVKSHQLIGPTLRGLLEMVEGARWSSSMALRALRGEGEGDDDEERPRRVPTKELFRFVSSLPTIGGFGEKRFDGVALEADVNERSCFVFPVAQADAEGGATVQQDSDSTPQPPFSPDHRGQRH